MRLKLSIICLLLMGSTFAGNLPRKDSSGHYENINNRQEYRYHHQPGLIFWYEGGRPFWRKDSSSQMMIEVENDVISAPKIYKLMNLNRANLLAAK